MKTYIICADGACSGNPGPGGYAWEMWDGAVALGNELSGGAGSRPHTTNNVMELRAAQDALQSIVFSNLEVGEVKLRFDSQYVLKGIFEWMSGWKNRGWKTGAGKPVANREIWESIDEAVTELRSRGFVLVSDWVKGHDGDMGNERVDTKAVEMRDNALQAHNEDIDEVINAQLRDAGVMTDPAANPRPSEAAQSFDNQSTLGRIMNEAEADMNRSAAAQAEAIHSGQVELMRTILDLHASGDYSVKKVIEQIRANAVALGCR
jgi:ribonuclease HI